jgi:hypothetical protein
MITLRKYLNEGLDNNIKAILERRPPLRNKEGKSLIIKINTDRNTLLIPVQNTDGKNWGFVALISKGDNPNIIKPLKGKRYNYKETEIPIGDFPHRGVATSLHTRYYDITYWEFDMENMTDRVMNIIDNGYYIKNKQSGYFGITATDRRYLWEPYHEFFGV